MKKNSGLASYRDSMLGGSTPKSSNNPANGTSNSGQQVGDSENMKVDESMPPRSCKNIRGTTRSTRTTFKLPRSSAKIKNQDRNSTSSDLGKKRKQVRSSFEDATKGLISEEAERVDSMQLALALPQSTDLPDINLSDELVGPYVEGEPSKKQKKDYHLTISAEAGTQPRRGP